MHSQLWSSPQHKNQMSFFNIDYLCTLTVKDGKYKWPRSLPILIKIYLDIDVKGIPFHYIQRQCRSLSLFLSLFNKTENYFHLVQIFQNNLWEYRYTNILVIKWKLHLQVHVTFCTHTCTYLQVYFIIQWHHGC